MSCGLLMFGVHIWRMCLQLYSKPLSKCPGWLRNIFFITFCPAAFVYRIWLHSFVWCCHCPQVLLKSFFNVLPFFKCTWIPCLLHIFLLLSRSTWLYGMTVWPLFLLGGSVLYLSLVFVFLSVAAHDVHSGKGPYWGICTYIEPHVDVVALLWEFLV